MSTFFTRQTRATLLLIGLIAAAGLGALATLGRQEDPTLVERFGRVVTLFPGASAERVEALVTEPLETAIMELAELDEVESTTRAGVSIVSVSLREDLTPTQVDQAWTLVREQVDQATALFPVGVRPPEVTREYIGAATMIVALTWSAGGEAPLGILTRLADDLEDRFQSLSGTEQTLVFGAAEEEVRVLADPDRLAALRLSGGDVAALIAAADAKAPAGRLTGPGGELGVEIAGELDGLDRVREVPLIQRPDGEVLRVGDIAQVEKGVRTPPASMAVIDGERAVFVAGYLTPGLRVDAWTDRARAAADAFKSELPVGVEAEIVFEQYDYVRSRLYGLAGNLMMSAGIVFAVLFVMMGWRAAIVVGAALPLTILMVLGIQRLTGEPLHQMSVTGLVIALGMLIDNAIVVVDDYKFNRRKGLGRVEAVDHAVRHLFAPLLASTLTTMLAFAPIALLAGPAGEFVGYIGITVIMAVGSSFFLAMTVIPAVAARFDSEAVPAGPPRFWRDGLSIAPLTAAHRSVVRFVSRRPWAGLLIGFGAPAFGFVLASGLPLQFFPPTDRDMFQTEIILPATASIAETREVAAEIDALMDAEPGFVSSGWVFGEATPRVYYNMLGGRSAQPNFAAGWVRTTGPEATRRIVDKMAPALRDAFPETRVLALPFEQGPPVPAPIELTVLGPDFGVLDTIGQDLRRVLAESRHVTYTTAGLTLGAPVAVVQADEAAAALGGRRLTELAGLVRADLDGAVGGSVLEGTVDLPVRVIVGDAARADLAAVRAKALPPAPGDEFGLGTPMAALGAVALEPQVAEIHRLMGARSNPIYGHIEPFTFADIAMGDFQARLDAAGFETPPGYEIRVGGEAAERGDAVGNLLANAVPLLIMILAALVLAFNSFSYAGVIGAVGFLSVGLAYLGVSLFGQPNGFNAIVGAMGLVGLSINGSIVVLAALKASTEAAGGDPDAVADTVVDASRHIVATTLTTVGGFTPLLLSGDSFWLPLASAIAGGVAGSAILALYFAPAAFSLMARAKARRGGGAARPAAAAAE